MFKLLMVLTTTSTCLFSTVNSGVPIATGGPTIINEGKDALLTCVVSENRSNNTVIWKRADEVLTAGMVRVTNDPRIRVLHDDTNPRGRLDSGGEVWVLLIKELRLSDAGGYVCELNSDPVLRSIHILSVKPLATRAPGTNSSSTTTESSDAFLVPPPLDATDNRSFWRPPSVAPQFTHDFTECCESHNVSTNCMGFCNVHNIIDGTTGTEPEACERDFPVIVRCMADGRNHVPCCVQRQIPDLCQDMCRGEYTPFTDLLKTRVSCVQHTLNGLQCILQGVQLIPSAPLGVTVRDISETGATINWLAPAKLANKVDYYTVNVTSLHSFDADALAGQEDDDEDSTSRLAGGRPLSRSTLHTVGANETSYKLDALQPLTMYAIVLTAHNEYGTSLPSDRVRIFTYHTLTGADADVSIIPMPSGESGNPNVDVPALPDIRSCCVANGMTHRMCLEKMCDPQKTDLATLPDFMVCAPWSNITFTCLANRIDHTPCCRARGMPAECFPLCSGKITTLDFSLFKCLRFLSEYSSCLFQGYGVLAGPPYRLKTIAKTSTFIILDWAKPTRLADTVSTYHIKFRRLGVGNDYHTVEKRQPPLILEGLTPDVYYEFYVVSVNAYGKSEPSPRLITRTEPAEAVDEVDTRYNMSACCQASGLLPQCAPLCSYNIRLSDMEKLGAVCRAQLPVIARCAAGGRDHTPCCQRRGVVPACMSLCRGVMPLTTTSSSASITTNASAASSSSASSAMSSSATTTTSSSSTLSSDCLSYAGNILQCFEEGTESIPGPPEDVHATTITNTTISLSWTQPDYDNSSNETANSTQPPNAAATAGTSIDATAAAAAAAATDDATTSLGDIDFVVQYGKVNNMTMYETVAKLEHELTTNETSIDLVNLMPHSLYRIMVVARGKYGTSLPSSMLLINTTAIAMANAGGAAAAAEDGKEKIYGAPSPPHSVEVSAQSATWMQLTWQPPEYSHPHERITYRVYHKPMKMEKFNRIETKVAWLRMNNLEPSSQHIVYVEAVGEHGTSLPSETLVAWTDPALPAFVDPPTVHPADNVPEGGSMTILCLALGNPAPTISLYVGGHLVRQDTSRHMVTVIHNVTADMEHVSCYADNGYGVPMQATRRVNICYAPKIQAAGITVASIGDEVELRCSVDAKPEPKTIFWRDHDGRVPVVQGGNYDIAMRSNETRTSLYTMTLRMKKLLATDVGEYFCHAENAYGAATSAVSVRIRNTPPSTRNVSECCAQANVSLACRSACSYYVDFDAVADKPECIVDFDKMMRCAADGSDHRSCCADANVPRKCLNWCRGESVRSKEICSLQYARTIIGCFEVNRDRLPGPPANIAVSVVSDSEVVIRWDPPVKNPNAVEGYRIFYHEAAVLANEAGGGGGGSGESPNEAVSNLTNATSMQNNNNSNNNNYNISANEIRRLDVKETSVSLDGLRKHVLYELVVKAANSFGASVLTDPVKFTLGEHHVTSATSYSHTVGTISGIVASLLAVLLAAAAIVFYRRHRANGKAAGNGVAFENPTYTRGLEQVQLPTVTSAITHNGNGVTRPSPSFTATAAAAPATVTTTTTTIPTAATTAMGTRRSNGIGAAAAAAAAAATPLGDATDAHTQCNEVNPTIYEELKLGQEGAGFKKLVP